MHRLPTKTSLAERLPLPSMRGEQGLGDGKGAVSLRRMSAANVSDCGNDLRGYAEAATNMVSGYVVRDESEARRECLGSPAHLGLGKLPDGMDLAPQDAACDGATGAGPCSPASAFSKTWACMRFRVAALPLETNCPSATLSPSVNRTIYLLFIAISP